MENTKDLDVEVPMPEPDAAPHQLVEAEETRRLYNELLYQVETKNPGETRHETALVYIRMAEKYLRNQNAQEVKLE